MKITTVSITYQRTHNLGNYSNIKPTCSLTADIEPGEDPAAVLQHLDKLSRIYIHQLIDDALEQQGDPPAFFDGPRYNLYIKRPEKYIVIAPEYEPLSNGWGNIYANKRHRRYNYLIENLDNIARENEVYPYTLIDLHCTDANQDKLPKIERLIIYYHKERKLILLAPKDYSLNDLPGDWREDGPHTRIRETLIKELETKAATDGDTFISLLDGATLPQDLLDSLRREEEEREEEEQRIDHLLDQLDDDDDEEYYDEEEEDEEEEDEF